MWNNFTLWFAIRVRVHVTQPCMIAESRDARPPTFLRHWPFPARWKLLKEKILGTGYGNRTIQFSDSTFFLFLLDFSVSITSLFFLRPLSPGSRVLCPTSGRRQTVIEFSMKLAAKQTASLQEHSESLCRLNGNRYLSSYNYFFYFVDITRNHLRKCKLNLNWNWDSFNLN